MDTTDKHISFNDQGVCNHCTSALARMAKEQEKNPEQQTLDLSNLLTKIKKEGQGKDYDCIIGVSGGVDSTMVAYKVKTLGLRPLAVHFDNGWNSELAVDNIKKTIDALDIDLLTHVVELGRV